HSRSARRARGSRGRARAASRSRRRRRSAGYRHRPRQDLIERLAVVKALFLLGGETVDRDRIAGTAEPALEAPRCALHPIHRRVETKIVAGLPTCSQPSPPRKRPAPPESGRSASRSTSSGYFASTCSEGPLWVSPSFMALVALQPSLLCLAPQPPPINPPR